MDVSCANRGPRGPLAIAVLALAMVLAAPAAASAYPASAFSPEMTPAEIYELEVQALGPEHAAEHYEQRTAADAQPQRQSAAAAADPVGTANVPAGGPPEQVGRWSTAHFRLPNFAIHMSLLPTGKVMIWGYPNYVPDGAGGYTRANRGLASIWDPAEGAQASAVHPIPPPALADWDGDGINDPTPIYCSGQSLLPSGALLIAGGNLAWPKAGTPYTEFAGIRTVFSFDPWTEQYVAQPEMAAGRWYPSQVLLGDGRTVILGGFTDEAPGKRYTDDLELFIEGESRLSQGSVRARPEGDLQTALYPHLFTLPDGDVLLAGPNRYGHTRLLDTTTMTWSPSLAAAAQDRTGGNAVMLPAGPSGSTTVVQIGGFAGVSGGGATSSTNTTERFDAARPGDGWTPWRPLVVNRSYANTVLLPDGSLVAVGGGTGYDPTEGSWVTDQTGDRRRVELWNKRSGSWRLGPAQREDRSYHSTAVLLPDGTVLSAGDDHHPYREGVVVPENPGDFSSYDTAEIYRPPYLYRSARPRITRAPRRLGYNADFGVELARGRGSRAVLMAPGSTTHGADMNQRLVPLRRTGTVKRVGINLLSPPNRNVAPPGYYMLFVLEDGVPSTASWVRLGPGLGEPGMLRRR